MHRFPVLVILAALLSTTACPTTRSDGSPRGEPPKEAERENLKGVVTSPATPSHERSGSKVPTDDIRPFYPIS